MPSPRYNRTPVNIVLNSLNRVRPHARLKLNDKISRGFEEQVIYQLEMLRSGRMTGYTLGILKAAILEAGFSPANAAQLSDVELLERGWALCKTKLTAIQHVVACLRGFSPSIASSLSISDNPGPVYDNFVGRIQAKMDAGQLSFDHRRKLYDALVLAGFAPEVQLGTRITNEMILDGLAACKATMPPSEVEEYHEEDAQPSQVLEAVMALPVEAVEEPAPNPGPEVEWLGGGQSRAEEARKEWEELFPTLR